MHLAIRTIAVLAPAIGCAAAHGNVVKQGQTILKAFGVAGRKPGAMPRGKRPFDLATFLAIVTARRGTSIETQT